MGLLVLGLDKIGLKFVQLVKRSLQTPEIHGSNPVNGLIYLYYQQCQKLTVLKR